MREICVQNEGAWFNAGKGRGKVSRGEGILNGFDDLTIWSTRITFHSQNATNHLNENTQKKILFLDMKLVLIKVTISRTFWIPGRPNMWQLVEIRLCHVRTALGFAFQTTSANNCPSKTVRKPTSAKSWPNPSTKRSCICHASFLST